MNTQTILLTVVSLVLRCAYAQNGESGVPAIDKPLPPFELKHVTHFSKSSVTNQDFHGKWLVMDFWFTGCSSCIKAMPKIDAMQRDYVDVVQFLLVGKNDQKFNKNIVELYEKLRAKMNLSLASAYDSLIFEQWRIWSMPLVIVVDPQGIVKLITHDLTPEKLLSVMRGKSQDGNGTTTRGEDGTLFSSEISSWNPGGENPAYAIYRLNNTLDHLSLYHVEVNRADLATLFLFSQTGYPYGYIPLGQLQHVKAMEAKFFGNFYPTPILEVKDSSLFRYDFESGKNIFNYKMRMGDKRLDSAKALAAMQTDLSQYFGLSATIEKRSLPVLKLVAYPGAAEKLRSRGRDFYLSAEGASGGPAGFTATNLPMKRLLPLLMAYQSDVYKRYFDETGLDINIDIQIDALMTDLGQIRKELNKYGLDLVSGPREFSAVVIRCVEN